MTATNGASNRCRVGARKEEGELTKAAIQVAGRGACAPAHGFKRLVAHVIGFAPGRSSADRGRARAKRGKSHGDKIQRTFIRETQDMPAERKEQGAVGRGMKVKETRPDTPSSSHVGCFWAAPGHSCPLSSTQSGWWAWVSEHDPAISGTKKNHMQIDDKPSKQS